MLSAAIYNDISQLERLHNELEPWARKVNDIGKRIKKLRIYFNNHYAGAAIINAMQFDEMLGQELPEEKKKVLEHAEQYYSEQMLF